MAKIREITGNEPPPSHWLVAKTMVKRMYAEGTLGDTVGFMIVIVSAVALNFFWTRYVYKHFILDAHKKLTEGNWMVVAYDSPFGHALRERPISSRPFSRADVIGSYLTLLPSLVLGLCTLACMNKLVADVRRTYDIVRAEIYDD